MSDNKLVRFTFISNSIQASYFRVGLTIHKYATKMEIPCQCQTRQLIDPERLLLQKVFHKMGPPGANPIKLSGSPLQSRLLSLTTNIRLGLPGTNTLAYYKNQKSTVVKSFIGLAPGLLQFYFLIFFILQKLTHQSIL